VGTVSSKYWPRYCEAFHLRNVSGCDILGFSSEDAASMLFLSKICVCVCVRACVRAHKAAFCHKSQDGGLILFTEKYIQVNGLSTLL
jgi:hypothetical protein